jgi:hypothetical protein
LGLHFLLDLLVEGAPLFSARSRRCSSTCSFILATPDISENVEWELQYVRETGLAPKLFLCSSPKTGDNIERFWLKPLGILFGSDALRCWGLRAMPWSSAAKCLTALGYQPPTYEPGPGAVIAAGSGEMQVIFQGATTPEQYISAIQSYRTVAATIA